MANSIGILNEGFKKYESIKPSFEDELYEAMKSLTERQQEWSDEDKHDNEILWGIRDKWQKRTNAKLTPEEKEIIKKYNIGEPIKYADGELAVNVNNPDKHSYDFSKDLFTKTIRPEYGRPYEGTSKKINVADRARKLPDRKKSTGTAVWDDDNFEWQYHDKLDKYDANYREMKDALRSRKNANKELADLDAGTHYADDKIKKAQKELDRAIQHKDWEYDYNRNAIDKSNKTINKLLKRESLSKKRMNESASDDYYDLTHNIAETAADIKKENPDMEMSDCVFEAIDQQLIYYADQWVVLQEFANPLDLFTEEIWDDFYNDIYGKVDEYFDDEDLEESLKSKKNRKINEEQVKCPNCGTSFDSDDIGGFLYSGKVSLIDINMNPYVLSSEFNSPVLFKEEIAECNNSEELLNVANTFDKYNNKWKIGTDNVKYTRLTKKDVWGNVCNLIVYKEY